MLKLKAETNKEKEEAILLLNLRFACLISKSANLMHCINVQAKITELDKYLKGVPAPSKHFDTYFCQFTGDLCKQFSLRVNAQGEIKVARKTHQKHLANVVALEVTPKQKELAHV
ncbi:hypothetical protein JQC92_02485 [Shewanella sp. 202IG2-18]|uniref:hypothetical protein n=1 Tax=Parashewanella hymeniacidonis TaxID=2807618 RepID=UPI00195F7A11|nr:hypothetical protein [Parashewanella hymeniacidonis]MBM7070909.1 hypothetical protein [Parashewanella hymeniacidonis]